jgi:hypothetical protein
MGSTSLVKNARRRRRLEVIAQLKENILERLEEWERRLGQALQRTQIDSERRRLALELSELRTVRGELDRLSEQQLQTLHDRLARDPNAYVEHRLAS